MAVILVAEDDKAMQEIIIDYMRRGSHTCIAADDGIDAMAILKSNTVDLAILDVMMPHLDGFKVCRLAREMDSGAPAPGNEESDRAFHGKRNIPILFLTAKTDEEDKLKGYECGADDYMTKPFSPKILLAKVNALLRRASSINPQEFLSLGDITMNLSAHHVMVCGNDTELTYKEFELLRFFMQNKNQVFSREQLLDRIWGYDFDGNTRTVDTHIKTLRQKLGIEGRRIVTLIRSGYKMEG